MKRGQITLFIIVGIVMIVLFTFVFYLVNAVSEQGLNQQQEKLTRNVLDNNVVQYLASECLEDALETGLILIGRQGGFILSHQLGGRATPNTLNFNNFDIATAIQPSTRNPPPLYPCPDTFLINEPAYCRYSGGRGVIFGESILPRLEGGSFSIQGQLQSYISSYVVQCLDIGRIIQEGGLGGYNVSSGSPTVRIEFKDTSVVAQMDYPLDIQIGGVDPVTHVASFEAQTQLRFKRLFKAIEDIVRKDSAHLHFNVSTDLYNRFFDTGDSQERIQFSSLAGSVLFNMHTLGEHDVFIFNDTFSRIQNQTYVFQFARKNRPPVLFYVQENASVNNLYDIVTVVGNDVRFLPKAVDPDEEGVSYSFQGPFGNLNSDQLVTQTVAGGIVSRPPGYYNQTVQAHDGLATDSQVVRVLVDDVIQPDFEVKSIYPNVPQDVVSREDPLILDATPTEKTQDFFATYTHEWNVFAASQGVLQQACAQLPRNNVQFPNYESCTDPHPNILAITDLTQNYPLTQSGVIQLDSTLTYDGGDTPTIQKAATTKNVAIVPCIPHRSPDFPYPYNNGDSYLADHACCLGDINDPNTWQIAGSGTECYNNRRNVCKPGRFVAFERVERDFCLSGRGNICGNGDTNPQSVQEVELPVCGCGAAPECDGARPFEFRQGNVAGLCYGTDGCELFCSEGNPIVDVTNDGQSNQGDTCGCSAATLGMACDKDADNSFSGVCDVVPILGIHHCNGE